eukprot:2382400-Prymnesium_polylepis.1
MRAATAPNEATDHGRGRHKKSTPDPFWAPSWDGGDGSGRRGSSRSPPRRPKPSYARRASPRAGGMPKSKSAAILDDMLSRSRAPAARGLTAPGLPGRTMPPVTPSKQPRRPKGGTAPAAVTRKVGAAPAPELSRCRRRSRSAAPTRPAGGDLPHPRAPPLHTARAHLAPAGRRRGVPRAIAMGARGARADTACAGRHFTAGPGRLPVGRWGGGER